MIEFSLKSTSGNEFAQDDTNERSGIISQASPNSKGGRGSRITKCNLHFSFTEACLVVSCTPLTPLLFSVVVAGTCEALGRAD